MITITRDISYFFILLICLVRLSSSFFLADYKEHIHIKLSHSIPTNYWTALTKDVNKMWSVLGSEVYLLFKSYPIYDPIPSRPILRTTPIQMRFLTPYCIICLKLNIFNGLFGINVFKKQYTNLFIKINISA